MRTSTRIAGLVSGLALTAGATVGIPLTANAAESAKPEACSQQAGQVEKAEDALARLTAKFAAEKKAGGGKVTLEKAAKAKKAKEAKKAQVQRLAKAEARYDACVEKQAETEEG